MASATKTRCCEPQRAPAKAPEAPKPIPATTQTELRPTFGCDLSHIRVHDGGKGAQVAAQHDARAVTVGGQIYFGRGEYQPKSTEGRQVLTHEVAHAVQQTKSGPAASSAHLESEAHVAASGTPVSLSSASPTMPLTLKRGERPTGPPSKGISKAIQKQLDRDPTDDSGEAKSQLGALAPKVRAEVAGQVRETATPDQKMNLKLDDRGVQPPPVTRTGPAHQEGTKPNAPAKTEREEKADKSERAEAKTPDQKDATGREAPGKAAPALGKDPAAPSEKGPAKAAAASGGGPSSPSVAPAASAPAAVQAAPMVGTEATGASPASASTAAPAAAGPAVGPEVAGGVAGGPAPAAVTAAPPVPPSAPTPEQNPAFQGVKQGVSSTAKEQRDHKPSSEAATSAQAAAQSPATEREGQAQANQAETMAAQKTNPFDRAAFKAALLTKVKDITPKNLEEADEFQDSGKAGEIKRDVSGQVESGTAQASGGIPEATAAPPDTSAVPARVAEVMQSDEAGPAPGTIPAGGAVQTSRPEEQVNLDNGPQQIDATMANAGVTNEQLQNSNEPTFTGAVAASDQAKEHSATAPGQFRAEEAATLGAEKQEASSMVGGDLQKMHTGRGSALGLAVGQQNDARTKTEQERIRVTGEINRRFGELKTAVEGRLAKVKTDAETEFDTGSETARQNFETYVGKRMDDYKDERYSGALGWARWLDDKLTGMPDEVNVFYTEGRDAYLAEMDAVIDRVAVIVETGLTEASTMIQDGKTAIHDYVTSLPENLQSIGAEAEKNLEDQFTQLEESVTDQRDQLVDSLAQRYVANVKAIDERITEMQAANKGLIDAALDAIVGVIKTIISLANTLLNVLARAASAIGMIIKDPIGFLGNLVSAIGQGLKQFLGKLGQYLIQGLLGWLFGALASAGIQMPATFDLKSILGLVLQILGLTYANIRMRAVKILGEGTVKALETTAEIFQVLITEGPAGLIKWIADQFDMLKETVMSQIRDFIMERVIMAGVQWILGLLNPVGAFIKACLAIKDIVVFFIERGSQILELVNAIIDSVVAIAQGNLTAAANWVEAALAKSIPVLISLLASILGLGGISEKVQAIIKKIQAPINKIIDTVIKGAASLVKGIGKALGFGRQPEKKDPSESVKDVAHARLMERLNSGHGLPEIKVIVGQVLAELRPQGLLNLQVTPPNEHGHSEILASASQHKIIGYLMPPKEDEQGRSVSVAMNGVIECSTPPAVTNGDLLEKEDLFKPGSKERIVNKRDTLGMVADGAGTNTIVTRTWNGIREYNQVKNETHAEHHFIAWLSKETAIRQTMRRLDIFLNPYAPCMYCAEELTALVRERKAAAAKAGQPPFIANITWTENYTESGPKSGNPTMWDEDVARAKMTVAFDQIRGPGKMRKSDAAFILRENEDVNRK